MRLFIAINFSDATRNGLLALRDDLSSEARHGRFSLQENLHLTLVFLGECDARMTAAVKAAMDAVVFEPFNLMIERVGRFKRDGGEIWWAGVGKSNALLELQSALTDELISYGFKLEKRKYSPHVTLGREVVTDTAPRQIKPFGETVTGIDLMKSEHIGGKLTYTAIYSV